MHKEDRYNSLIQYYAELNGFDFKLIKSQIWKESNFNPKAISSVGARGLMQLMPATGQEMGLSDFFNPEENIIAGIKYLKIQYQHFPEIPLHEEKIKFSLASYNGGRGYLNTAIKLSKKDNIDYTKWDNVSKYLSEELWPKNLVKPDFVQIIVYVNQIMLKFKSYT